MTPSAATVPPAPSSAVVAAIARPAAAHRSPATRGVRRPRRVGLAAVAVAAGAGTVHAAFTLHWALGGTALSQTVGAAQIATIGDRLWLLLPVGGAKLALALFPLLMWRRGWSALTGLALWAAAAGMLVWGGLNAVVAHLVLAGAIAPGADDDHAGMIGHAWIWDPLFALWGLALAVALVVGRPRHQ